MFSFHSKYFVYRELKGAPQKLSFVSSVRILVTSGYWATYCTCENTKLLCLEFMLESAEEQHGLILLNFSGYVLFFIKSCKLQLNILFVCLFFLVKVSKRNV